MGLAVVAHNYQDWLPRSCPKVVVGGYVYPSFLGNYLDTPFPSPLARTQGIKAVEEGESESSKTD